jgi:hypothetical protein
MDLEEIKSQLHQVKAPAMSAGFPGTGAIQAADLIGRLKEYEAQEQRRLQKARILYGVATGLFTLFVAVPFLDPEVSMSGPRFLYGVVLAAVFALNAILAGRHLSRLSRLDYSRPAREFLAAAEERYVFYTREAAVIALVGLTILGLSAGVYIVDEVLARYLPKLPQAGGIAGFVAAYLLVCLLGLHFTYRNWKRDKAPLLAQIRQVRADLEDAAPESETPGFGHGS